MNASSPGLLALVLLGGCVHDPALVDGHVDPHGLGVLQQETARVRQLPFIAPVTARTVTGVGLSALVVAELDREAAAVAREDALLRRMGIVRDGTTLRDVELSFIGGAAAGVYFDHDKTLYVVADYDVAARAQLELMSWMTGVDLTYGPILGHELTHALQDQHLGLSALADLEEVDADRALALRSMYESEANVVTQIELNGTAQSRALDRRATILYGWANYALAGPLMGLLSPVPAYFWDLNLGHYTRGLPVLLRLLDEGGWGAVDRAYRDGRIRSTEQLMWPEKLFDDVDLPVAVPALPPP